MRHVVNFSGGLCSFWAAVRVAEKFGTDDLTLLFADTLVEDEELYEFNQRMRMWRSNWGNGGAVRVIRVFPRKTKGSPEDSLAYFGGPDHKAEADEVHISVTFTADKPKAEFLERFWKHVAPVKIGGVAYGDEGRGYFEPGKYIKHGYTFTSRGCPQRCWFCSVWKRRPQPVPIWPFASGWNILDDNLLACPDWHVKAVFDMLALQGRRVHFTGGLEALALTDWHVGLLADLKPRPACFFAYDPGDPFETLESAARRMLQAGFTRESHRLHAYVLIGYPKDTLVLAEKRLKDMKRIGFTPYAMLWEPETPSAEKWRPTEEWRGFARIWRRPAIIHAKAVGATEERP